MGLLVYIMLYLVKLTNTTKFARVILSYTNIPIFSNGCYMHGCSSIISDACVTCRSFRFMLRNSQICAPTMACIQKCLIKKANILFHFSSKFKFVPEFWGFFYLNHSFQACKIWCWKIDFWSELLFSTIVSFCSQNKAFHPLLFVAT